MPEKKAVIFDMDGVLIDSMPAHRASHAACLKEVGIEVDERGLDRYAGWRIDAILRDVMKKQGVVAHMKTLMKRRHELFFKELEKATPIPGAQVLVKVCKEAGFRTALASASTRQMVTHIVETLGLGRYFDALVSGDEVEVAKPEPAIFLKAAEKAGVRADHCVVIEDATHGVTAAKRAGMACLGYKAPGNGHDLSKADQVVESLLGIEAEVFDALIARQPKQF